MTKASSSQQCQSLVPGIVLTPRRDGLLVWVQCLCGAAQSLCQSYYWLPPFGWDVRVDHHMPLTHPNRFVWRLATTTKIWIECCFTRVRFPFSSISSPWSTLYDLCSVLYVPCCTVSCAVWFIFGATCTVFMQGTTHLGAKTSFGRSNVSVHFYRQRLTFFQKSVTITGRIAVESLGRANEDVCGQFWADVQIKVTVGSKVGSFRAPEIGGPLGPRTNFATSGSVCATGAQTPH